MQRRMHARKHTVSLSMRALPSIPKCCHQLYASRVGTLGEAGLEHHVALFNRLRVRDMSDDESDDITSPGRKIYRITRAKWQSRVLRAFVRGLDAKYLELREDASRSGRWWITPRIRVEHPEASRPAQDPPPAPIGLWRNCYDQDWLDSLSPSERAALQVEDEDYNFDLTPLWPVSATGSAEERQS